MFYDKDVLAQWRANMPIMDVVDFHPLPCRYKSIWRVLHIDGFEERTIQFFSATQLDI
jgi:hypothetical protein